VQKDTVYSMRMNSKVREALKRAAKKEYRTVASLLDKIITDYLEKEGFLLRPEFGAERRKFPRRKITLPAKTYLGAESKAASISGVVLDISKGGVLVTYAKGTNISFTSKGELPHLRVCFALPRARRDLSFECKACHMREEGHEIQVGASFINPGEKDLQRLSTYLM
jgi:hypothetical protein